MNYTEKEAAEKWCPHVRGASGCDDQNASNTGASAEPVLRNPGWSRCIGSQCMAWRWGESGPPYPNAPEFMRFVGRCGLAGGLD